MHVWLWVLLLTTDDPVPVFLFTKGRQRKGPERKLHKQNEDESVSLPQELYKVFSLSFSNFI